MEEKERPSVDGALYEVTELFSGKPNLQAVQVSFSLDAPGWNKLQKSDAWRHLLKTLADFQKEQKHFVRSGQIRRRKLCERTCATPERRRG